MWTVASILLHLRMHVLVGCKMSEVEHDNNIDERIFGLTDHIGNASCAPADSGRYGRSGWDLIPEEEWIRKFVSICGVKANRISRRLRRERKEKRGMRLAQPYEGRRRAWYGRIINI